jgi:preprotein translocase subunit SecY
MITALNRAIERRLEPIVWTATLIGLVFVVVVFTGPKFFGYSIPNAVPAVGGWSLFVPSAYIAVSAVRSARRDMRVRRAGA